MENENFVAEQVTENVEQTTEQTPRLFTQDEVNEIVGKSKARTRAKVEKEFQRKYGELEDLLRAGTGKEDVEEITENLRGFYSDKGVKLPQKGFSAKDIEALANSDAAEIIRGGHEDVVEEVERLSKKGADKMSDREKATFRILMENRKQTEQTAELAKLGVTEEVYKSPEFQGFASKFGPNTPITEVYQIYEKTLPKKEVKPMGSMKNTTPDSGVKDFYSFEEAKKFSKADLDKNPALYKAIQESMRKW